MNKYVVGFLFDSTLQHVLLIEKQRPAWQKGRLNGVGGHIEMGESPSMAMAREWSEEADLSASIQPWRPYCVLTGSHWRVHFFASVAACSWDALEAAARPRTDEQLMWTPCVSLARDMRVIPNLRWLVPLALDESVTADVLDMTPDEESH